MERRTLLAVILCFGIFFAWQKLYLEPRLPKRLPPQAVNTVPTENKAKPQVNLSTPQAQKSQLAPMEQPIQLSTGTAKISNGMRMFSDWDIKSYRLGISPSAARVDLESVTRQKGEVEIAFDRGDLSYLSNVRGDLKSIPGGTVWTYEDSNVRITRQVTGSESQAYVDVKVTADFKSTPPQFAFISMASQGSKDDEEALDRQLIYWTNQSIERVALSDLSEIQQVQTPVKWIGATSRYFLLSIIAQSETSQARALLQPVGENHGRISLVYPVSGNQVTIPFKAYFGPKELNTLRSVEPSLDLTVDFGWFTVIAYPLLRFMKWLYEIFHNYGVAIILLTIVIKILLYPLTYKSMKSMKEMARIQPQLQKIREKYADDKEALNREMINLMRTHGYNPMAGCLPILLQMPIFFALYRVLYSSIELYQAPFFLWIHDLSAKDPFYVTPVVLTLVMYIQQKLTPNTATDPVQRRMIQFMPVIFGAFMLTLPSGLTLYMLVNALASIVQQLILNKKLDMGNVAIAPARAR